MRSVAYRQYVRLVYEYIGASHRIPLPNCVYNSIRKAFPNTNGQYTGYEEEAEEDWIIQRTLLLPVLTGNNLFFILQLYLHGRVNWKLCSLNEKFRVQKQTPVLFCNQYQMNYALVNVMTKWGWSRGRDYPGTAWLVFQNPQEKVPIPLYPVAQTLNQGMEGKETVITPPPPLPPPGLTLIDAL